MPELSVTHNLVLRRQAADRRHVLAPQGPAHRRGGARQARPRAHRPPRRRSPTCRSTSGRWSRSRRLDGRPRILILDEATSSLGGAEVERLFELVRSLRDQGTTVVVITHRMNEVWALADRMTILRDGRTVGRTGRRDRPAEGGEPHGRARHARHLPGEGARRATDAGARAARRPAPPRARDHGALRSDRGEILGLGGLQGQGQREFLHWLYGARVRPRARSCATGVACASAARATR